MKTTSTLAILLVAIGIGSFVIGLAYTSYAYSSFSYQNLPMMVHYTRQAQTAATAITLDQATSIAQQYLSTTRNSNLGIKEIMDFQNNFYVMYYEKDTGMGAFEMLIWKQTPPQGMGMGTGMMVGVIMPEPGPNMMWNTKYSFGGMMGRGMMNTVGQSVSPMTIGKEKALQLGQAYLNASLNDATVEEDSTQFYGYYTIDFTINGKTAGMLSVNGYTGQVWIHSWHGGFIQEVQFY